MNGSQRVFGLLTGASSLLLVLCYATIPSWTWLTITLITGAGWITGQLRKYRWSGHVGLSGFVILCARGLFLNIPDFLLLMACVMALAAWDIHMFLHRMDSAGHVKKRSNMERSHYKKVSVTTSIGLILGAVSLGLDFSIGFWWTFVLGLALVLLMGWMFKGLIQKTG